MSKKFELSLWKDYQPFEDIRVDSRTMPGSSLQVLIDEDILESGQCYYVWGSTDNKPSQWMYPCSFTHRENGKYYFINEYGESITINNIDGYVGLPKYHTKEEKLKVLINENLNQFQGKIFNIHLISKNDGTNTLTFDAPKYYQDIFSETKKKNEYLDLLYDKAKLKLFYEDEWYDFVINKRTEKKTKGYIIYSFEANDLSVEELSKTGFTLNLTDSEDTIEYSGLGTVEELTDRILVGTDWKFNKELTIANLQEYIKNTKYNALTNLYEDTQEPTMIYKNHYSPALKKYVYQTEFYVSLPDNIKFLEEWKQLQEFTIAAAQITTTPTTLPIYYTTRTQTDCSGSTNNLIASNSQFTGMNDWKVENESGKARPHKIGDDYYLKVSSGTRISTHNFTTNRLESKPYGFKIETNGEDSVRYTVTFYNGNSQVYQAQNLITNKNYCLYPDRSFGSLYMIIEFQGSCDIKQFSLYEIAIRNRNNETLSVTQSTLGTSTTIKRSNLETSESNISFDYKLDTEYNNRGIIGDNYILLPNAIVSATARPEKLYFIEPYNTLSELQYATNDNTLEESSEEYIIAIEENLLFDKLQLENNIAATYKYDDGYQVFNTDNISLAAAEYLNKYVQYINQYGQIYYYTPKAIDFKGKTYYLWKDATLQYTDQKRRLLTGSRSNRYNFIQNIAENFEVYPKFKILHNPETGEWVYKDNHPIKWIYYVDCYGDMNYSGFKEGINVSEINRKIISDNVVTKMYVDNIDTDYSDDGYVSIQLAQKNPSLENYIYNFKYYLNTGILDKDFEKRLTEHERCLRAINQKYLKEVKERDRLADTLNELEGHKLSLETSLEESKATVEQIKEEFTRNVDYYLSNSGNWKGEDFIKNYKKPLLTSNFTAIEVESDIEKGGYDSFYCVDPAYRPTTEDKSYMFLLEVHTILDEASPSSEHAPNALLLGAKLSEEHINANETRQYWGTNSNAYNDFIGEFKESKMYVGGKPAYLLKTQQEIFKLNQNLPYDPTLEYCQEVSDHYIVLSAAEAKEAIENKEVVYIRYVTSENSDWFYWKEAQIFIRCHLGFNGTWYRRIWYLIPPRYLENYSNENAIDWLTKNRYFSNSGIRNVVIPAKQGEIDSRRAVIDELITGENGQTELIEDLHSIKLEYYDTLTKYKTKVIEVNRLLKEKKSLIEDFEKQYIQYIKEGYWGKGNKQYVDHETYYLDAKALVMIQVFLK
jgi:hypothetical protein